MKGKQLRSKEQRSAKDQVGRDCKTLRKQLLCLACCVLGGLSLLQPSQAAGLEADLNAPASTPMVAQTGDAFWHGSDFMTNLRDVSLALTSVLLLMALGWSVSLRRQVKSQTVRIRLQVAREKQLERKYQELFENANDMVFSLDLTGQLVSLNKAGEKILGCSRERALRAKLQEFVVPAQREAYHQWLDKCFSGAALSSLEIEVAGHSAARSTLELSARVLRDGERVSGVEGIARDITERRRAEAALRESEQRFSSAFRVSPVAIAISKLTDGRYVDVNESFSRLFGYSREEVLERTSLDLKLFAREEERLKIDEWLHQKHSVCGAECTFRVRSGETRTGLVFAERIDLGSVPSALTIVHDMTDRLKLEDRLRQASKMEAVGRLAAGVAHDFNNLLMIVQGNAELALLKNSGNPEVARALDKIAQAAQRAACLTHQLLTFSRRQTLQPKPLDLNDLINNATKMFKHLLTDQVDLRFKFGANLPMVKADPVMLEQVIMNLVVNARDAMPQGGELTIATAFQSIDESSVRCIPEASAGDYVCLMVSDTGCGMDEKTRARIFEPFFTTKEGGKGTGLGLATVYGIVRQHNGWVEVVSEPGRGSAFRVFLPSDKVSVHDLPHPCSTPSAARGTTILLVEDEPALVELVRAFLQPEGYRILEAADGLSALQLWNDNQGHIDLLLTDIKMPHGMSGIDLAENLRALKPDLKVILSSGYTPETLNPELHLGSHGIFLAKPYSAAKLLQTVRSFLASPPTLAAA